MKPETLRLIILDVLLAVACVMQMVKGVSPLMWWPNLLSELVLLGYGIWLLSRMWDKEQLPP